MTAAPMNFTPDEILRAVVDVAESSPAQTADVLEQVEQWLREIADKLAEHRRALP